MWSRSEGDGPPVVFLHGWMMDHVEEVATYDAAFAARGYRRIYLDLPGMGNSADLGVPHDLDGYADAICDWIGAALGDQRFLLAGTSAGALIASGVAARMGGQVAGLLMRVPLIHGPEGRRQIDPVPVLHPDAEAMAALSPDARKALDGDPIIQRKRWSSALIAKLKHSVLPAMRRANTSALTPLRSDDARYDLRRGVGVFDRPALILMARQDSNVGWRDAMTRFADWPRASLALLDAAGHEFPLSHQVPLTEALVADWLDRVEMAA